MREVTLDFTNDTPRKSSGFWGHIGEHNATLLKVILSDSLMISDYINVEFEISNNNKVVINKELSKDNYILVPITHQVSQSETVAIQVVGYTVDENTGEIKEIAKTHKITGHFRESVKGIETDLDIYPSMSERAYAKATEAWNLIRESKHISFVTELPQTASEGDVVYYCPLANTLTSEDSEKQIHFDFSEMERLIKYALDNSINTVYAEYIFNNGRILIFAQPDSVSLIEVTIGDKTEDKVWVVENGVLREYTDDEYTQENIIRLTRNTISLPKILTSENLFDNKNTLDLFNIFQIEPSKYRFYNNMWTLLPGNHNDKSQIPIVTNIPHNPSAGDIIAYVKQGDITADDANSTLVFNFSQINMVEGVFDVRGVNSSGAWLFTIYAVYERSRSHVEVVEWTDFAKGFYRSWNMVFRGNQMTSCTFSDRQTGEFVPLTAEAPKFLHLSSNLAELVVLEQSGDYPAFFEREPVLMIFNDEWTAVANESMLYRQNGALVKSVQEIDKIGGQKYLRINLEWGKNTGENYIDIPISASTEVSEESDGIITNGTEIDLGIPEQLPDSEFLSIVSSLPDTANEGDIVLYCPNANELTLADSGNTVFIDFDEAERLLNHCLSENLLGFRWMITASGSGLSLFQLSFNPEADSIYNIYMERRFYDDEEGSLVFNVKAWKIENGELKEFSDEEYAELHETYGYEQFPSAYFKLSEDFSPRKNNSEVVDSFEILQAKPRKYRFSNGAWRLLPEQGNVPEAVTDEHLATAIENYLAENPISGSITVTDDGNGNVTIV